MRPLIYFLLPIICLSNISLCSYAFSHNSQNSSSSNFETGSSYIACFTPQEDCTALLVNQIKEAKNIIYVQSYSFTSYKIAKALIDAYERGVQVNLILDNSDFDPQFYSQETYLKASGLSIWKDNQVRIAHNKVMIFDENIIETGSFNYTVSAQKYNAENMLIIKDKTLAEIYLKNWHTRQALSIKIN